MALLSLRSQNARERGDPGVLDCTFWEVAHRERGTSLHFLGDFCSTNIGRITERTRVCTYVFPCLFPASLFDVDISLSKAAFRALTCTYYVQHRVHKHN